MSELVYRIGEVARYFAEKGYQKTVAEIVRICKELQKGKVDENFPERVSRVSEILQTEFTETLVDGQEFRKKCFWEIHNVILAGANKIEDFSSIEIILKRINEIDQAILPVAELFEMMAEKSQMTEKEKILVFHLFAYVYLIGVEGIFPELARILYFFTEVAEDHAPSYEELESENPRKIRKKLKKKIGRSPVFLKNWEEKKHLRNAIAHAQCKYDPSKDEISYAYNYNGKIINRRINMRGFTRIHMEIIDSLDAFRYTMQLLNLYELFASAWKSHK